MVKQNTRLYLAILLGLSFFLFFFRLGERSFRNPDEGRYAEIARGMVESGNWVEPKIYGVDYLKKPVLFYWLLALAITVFGLQEWALRLVPALFGVLGILSTFFFAKKFFGEKPAFLAALILTTNLWYWGVCRYLLIDSVFSFFLVGAFYLFYLERYRLFFAALALAFLAKGAAALAISGFCLLAYALLTGQTKRLLDKSRFGWGVLIFAAITFPWFILISQRQPEFFDIFFLHEHVNRFVSKSFEHQEPWYFYWVLFPLIFFPWWLWLGRPKKINPPGIYLLICSVGTVLFYSLSKGKLATYLLPCIPMACIVLGSLLVRLSSKIFYSLLVVLTVAPLPVVFLMEKVNVDYTTAHFARVLKPKLKSGDLVLLYGAPGAFYDFGFYLQHPVKVVGFEGELELSTPDEENMAAVMQPEEFRRALEGGGPNFYCLMRQSDFQGMDMKHRRKLQILMEDRRKVLLKS